MLLEALGLLLLGLVSVVVLHYVYTVHWLMRNCTTPIGYDYLPVVGNLFGVLKNLQDVSSYFYDVLKHAPEGTLTIWAYVPLCPPFIVTVDPKVAQHMLKDKFENYPKGQNFERIIGLLGDGIFRIDGAHWKAQRRLGAHTFKGRLLKEQAIDTYSRHADPVLDKLEQACVSKKDIDVQDIFMRFTLDSIGEIAFGRNIDSQTHPTNFHQEFDNAQKISMERLILPWWQIHRSSTFNNAMKVLNTFCNTVIKEKQALSELDETADVVSRFVAGQRAGKDKEYGFDFDTKFIRDVVMNFIVAGRDTTAITLTFSIYNLSGNPEAMRRLQAEIDETCGAGAEFKRPTYEQLTPKAMPFMRAVIDETLRLFPPVYIDPKTCQVEDTLPNGETIPAGAWLCWSQFLMSRVPQFWSGGDVEAFLPERWLDTSGTVGSAARTGLLGESEGSDGVMKLKAPLLEHPYQFIPFQAGPRTCLGMRMAYVEVGYLLCCMLSRYNFTRATGDELKLFSSITLQADSMPMKVSLRS